MSPAPQEELSSPMTELRGITWDHTRGYLPMVATAQRFSEIHPEVVIRWEKRSLKQFGDLSLTDLAGQYDLLVVDHPFIGTAAAERILVPLNEHLPAAFLKDQAANSVGKSNASYILSGDQYALAVDAAAPICGWRSDLLAKAESAVPSTWDELMELAKRGKVALSGVRIDMLMHLYMLCIAFGEEPFVEPGIVVSRDVIEAALEKLRELAQAVSPEFSKCNPIMVWERLANGDEEAYCPFAYGYSNYSRQGYAKHSIEVGGLISIDGRSRCRSTLGGAGLAISSRCRSIDAAAEYCRYTAGAECQARVYFESGGQPGHWAAWTDEEVNRRSHGFFQKTLQTLDEAWLRPRWNGYHLFQDEASLLVHQFAWRGGVAREVASSLNRLAERLRQRERAGGDA